MTSNESPVCQKKTGSNFFWNLTYSLSAICILQWELKNRCYVGKYNKILGNVDGVYGTVTEFR